MVCPFHDLGVVDWFNNFFSFFFEIQLVVNLLIISIREKKIIVYKFFCTSSLGSLSYEDEEESYSIRYRPKCLLLAFHR